MTTIDTRRKHIRMRDGTVRDLSEFGGVLPDGATVYVPLHLMDSSAGTGSLHLADDASGDWKAQVPDLVAAGYVGSGGFHTMTAIMAEASRAPTAMQADMAARNAIALAGSWRTVADNDARFTEAERTAIRRGSSYMEGVAALASQRAADLRVEGRH